MESERRQIFFGAAIGLPTFFVQKDTPNLFLRKILLRVREVRQSHRYPGYLRIHVREYQKALLQVLIDDGRDLIEALGLRETMEDLLLRLEHPDKHSAAGKLTNGILGTLGAKTPLDVNASVFNEGAEKYYRETLRRQHFHEGLQFLEEDCLQLDLVNPGSDEREKEALRSIFGDRSAADFLRGMKRDLLEEQVPLELLRKLINLVIVTIHRDTRQARA